ncbi:variant erythrocyte surface antigen-1 family protein [Babesia divergens]|uniref:Variant erythrocyte surface antigen-1 family protein n=1 Tax=Babesia divergens TaxID=32595 RepID=A0AAD9GBV6_BABDI|nr:variant erythrocyte surface antigen-1 family protein [Babesia divergens]
MVCCMYYTDVFVGQDNIENLKNALKAELEGSVQDGDLTQLTALAEGLKSFIGYSGGGLDGNGIGKNDTGGSQNGYSSSYKSPDASWEKLCKNCQCKSVSNSSSHSCSCGSQSGSVCSDPLKCCENCDVRRAAKIFLGFLPCLYYGLKILWVRCNDASQWPKWSGKISTASDLNNFLKACGYDLKTLNDLQASQIYSSLNSLFKNDSNGTFDNLYNIVSKEYFSKTLPSSPCSSSCPSPSPSSSHVYPSTVRSILLWLSGLPFSKGFNALLQYSKGLCPPSEKSLNSDEFLYCIHVSCFLLPISVISAIQHPGASKSFIPSPSDWEPFCYPEDPFDLFNMLLENVRKVFVPLKFLCLQCENGAAQGGWTSCTFGQTCAEALKSSSTSGSFKSSGCGSCDGHETYLCTWTNSNQTVHDGHCLNGQCLGSGPCTSKASNGHASAKPCTPCPHPLLRFLIDDFSESSDSQPENSQKFRTPFHSSTVTPMGFSQGNLSSTGKKGFDLHRVLHVFCDDGFYPLTRLAEFSLCVSRHPPETLLDLYAFFVKFKDSDVFKNDFASYASGEPGTPDGSALQSAVQGLYGSSNSHSNSHPFDLMSISGCHANKASPPTCGPYLYSLTGDIYNIFVEDFVDTYLSWICYLAKDFKTLLERFHAAAEKKFSKCCSSGSCQKIVTCPCAHPLFYSHGFTFMKASTLSGGTPKKCSDFLDQLKKVLEENSPLGLLIKQIENFLWSIRFPFFFGFLYVWFCVLSYFCYVILIKLDTVHTGSHLHLPRSFKILPSTLFSDASSRLKDLSYFTL